MTPRQIRQRRRNANRLGFAVHLAYLRFPGRVLGPKETPPAYMLAFISMAFAMPSSVRVELSNILARLTSLSLCCRSALQNTPPIILSNMVSAASVERTIGWQRLEETVEAMDQNLGGTRADNLAEVIESYPRVHRTATIILGAFTFRSWKSTDSLLTALEALR